MPKRRRHGFERVGECLPAVEKQPADHSLEDIAGSHLDVGRPEPELDD
jgi:hypothetical protein